MLIGELAQQAEVTPDTIRFYEKKGLLDERHLTRKGNSYKDYGPAALERLQFISRAKLAGFTLGEIVRLGQEWDTLNPEERRKVFVDKIRQIDHRIAELEKMKAYLTAKAVVSIGGV